MTPQEIYKQLAEIVLEPDFISFRTGELTENWRSQGVGAVAVDPILKFIEDHPSLDYGAPGPLVHFIEAVGRATYEARLLASVERKPTIVTVGMVNRLINGTTNDRERRRLAGVVRSAKSHPRADQVTKDLAGRYLTRLGY